MPGRSAITEAGAEAATADPLTRQIVVATARIPRPRHAAVVREAGTGGRSFMAGRV
jgi:hypothetical protein